MLRAINTINERIHRMNGHKYSYNIKINGVSMVYIACSYKKFEKLNNINKESIKCKVDMICYEDIEIAQRISDGHDCIVGIMLKTDKVLDKLSLQGMMQIEKDKQSERLASCVRDTVKQPIHINDKDITVNCIRYILKNTDCIQGVGIIKKIGNR